MRSTVCNKRVARMKRRLGKKQTDHQACDVTSTVGSPREEVSEDPGSPISVKGKPRKEARGQQ